MGLGQLRYFLEGHVYQHSKFYSYLREKIWSDKIHRALDVLGSIPAIGEIFDIGNAAYYSYQGNSDAAIVSGCSALLAFGDLAKFFRTASNVAGNSAYNGVQAASKYLQAEGVLENTENKFYKVLKLKQLV